MRGAVLAHLSFRTDWLVLYVALPRTHDNLAGQSTTKNIILLTVINIIKKISGQIGHMFITELVLVRLRQRQ